MKNAKKILFLCSALCVMGAAAIASSIQTETAKESLPIDQGEKLILPLMMANDAKLSGTTTSISGFTLSLEDSINILAYVKNDVSLSTDSCGLEVWKGNLDGTPIDYDSTNPDHTLQNSYKTNVVGTEYSVFTLDMIAAKEMTVNYYLRSYYEINGEREYSNIKRYSILDYCLAKANSTEIIEGRGLSLGELTASVLQYGANAQKYLNYNTDRLATDKYIKVTIGDGLLSDGVNNGYYKHTDSLSFSPTNVDINKDFYYWIDSDYSVVSYDTDTILSLDKYCDYEKVSLRSISQSKDHIQEFSYQVDADGNYNITSFNGDGEEIIFPMRNENGNVCNFYFANNTSINASNHKILMVSPSMDKISIPNTIKNTEKCNLETIVLTNTILDFTFNGVESLKSVSIPCKNIKDSAFQNCLNLEKVMIMDGVESIGYQAFSNCSSLKTAKLSSTVRTLGGRAFYKCTSLEDIYLAEGVTSIPSSCFDGDISLRTVNIPGSAESIYGYAFANCSSLESVYMSDGVKYIENAFKNCSNLKTVFIPDSVEILKSSFSDCKNVEFVHISSILKQFGSAFSGTSITSITIPYGVESIDSFAFSGCNQLESVSIPSTVKSIGDQAFQNCSSLKEISVPSGIESIGMNAFSNCLSLKKVTIEESVVSIGSNAFSGCSSLETVSLKQGIKTIGSYAFGNCTSLKTISLPDTVTTIGNQTFKGCSSLSSVRISSNVTSLVQTFQDCSLNSVTIPSKVTTIQDAFHNCKFTSVSIPGSVTNIDGAFVGCKSLNSITIPSSVTTFSGTFNYCSSLSNVTLPSTLKSIGDNAFNYCHLLRNINFPNSLLSIGNRAFGDCYSLVSANLPSNITEIGNNAFSNCYLLSSLSLPKNLVSIGQFAFGNDSKLESVMIPDGLQIIGSEAFRYCGLTSIAIPGSVQTIDSSAFAGCPISNVKIGNGVKTIGSRVFNRLPAGTTIYIPASVETIGDYAFMFTFSTSEQSYVYCEHETKPIGWSNQWCQYAEVSWGSNLASMS